MSEAQNSGTQQQAWRASNANNLPTSFHRPPPLPGPYNNTQQGFGTGDRPQNHMPMNARPPIRPPMENTQFTLQQHSAPASLHRSIQQYNNSGWGVLAPASGSAAGAHGQWEPSRQAPNLSAPGSNQSSWGALNSLTSPWYNVQQPFAQAYPPGNSMMSNEGRRNFTNLPLPPPPPPPTHQGNTQMNYLNMGAPAPLWSSMADRTALQRDPTDADVHGIARQHLPNFGAATASQHENGISYQGAPFLTQQSSLSHSQSYMTAPVQQNLSQPVSFQHTPIPAPALPQTQTTHFGHITPKPSISTRPQLSCSHGAAPPALFQVPAGHASVPLQNQQPPEGSKSKGSKNRRKRKRQERKNRVNTEEVQAAVAVGAVTLIENEASSGASSTGGQFSDPVDNELDQEMVILEFLIKKFDIALSTGRAGPDASLLRDLEVSCEKIRELEGRGNHPVPTLEVAERRAELTRRAREIMFSRPLGGNTVSLSEDTSETIENSRVNDIGHSDIIHVHPPQVAPYSQKTAVPNHSVATGSAVHNVEFAVESDSKEITMEASAPRKSASRALEEAKAKLRLAKLHMSLAAKKKALQAAKAKSGQIAEPINALLKGGLDCFVVEQIASSGPTNKIRFLDALLDDDTICDTDEKHSSDMSMDDDSSDDIRIRADDPPLDPTQENLPVLRDEPSLLQRITELQNLTLSKLKNFESGTKLQRLDKVGLTSLLRDTVDKTMEEPFATLEATSSLGSSKESKVSTRALLKKRKEEALRTRAVAHHKNVISKQQRMLRKQLVETEQIDQSIRVIDEEVLMLSNQQCPDLRGKIRTLDGRKQVLDDMLAGYLAELMGLRKELHTSREQSRENSGWILSST